MIWKKILIQAVLPHIAVADLYCENIKQLSTSDIKWITPVLHSHYHKWKATPPNLPDRLTQDPNWHLKIDRVSQYNSVNPSIRINDL